ncbi:MAG: ABC transporter substrate-binding protein [Rhodospirillales bacterium]
MGISGKLTWAAAIVIAGVLGATPSWAGKKDDTLNVIVARDVLTLDNMYATRRENHILTRNYDDMLFYLHPQTGEVIPLLVESYKVEGSTADLVLKKGIKFHDGSELTAEDVAYSINFQSSKKSKAYRQKYLGRWIKKAVVTGPYSVRINMKHAYPLVAYDLAAYSRIRKKGTYDDPSKEDGINRDAARSKLIGLGPYKIKEYVPMKRIVLERFEDYRKDSPKGFPSIKRITLRTVPDYGVQAAEIMAGNADMAFYIPHDIAADVQKSGRAKHVLGYSMRIGFIVLDAAGATGKDAPTTKLKVRQALNHAFDRESLVKTLIKGTGEVIHSACNPVQFGCAVNVKKYEYDPEKAKKLLAEAGYPNGFSTTLWAYREKYVAEALVGMLKKVGIKAKLRYLKGSQLRKAEKNNEVMMTFRTHGSTSVPHVGKLVPLFFGGGDSRNDRYISHDKEVVNLVRKATSTHDENAQKEFFEKALQRVAEQAYWVPLYKFSLNYLLSNDLEFDPPKDGMPRLFLAKWK